jgi:hypothetical protein
MLERRSAQGVTCKGSTYLATKYQSGYAYILRNGTEHVGTANHLGQNGKTRSITVDCSVFLIQLFLNVYYMPAYTSNQGTEILSNYRSVLGPKLSESLRDKIVEDVMRFPTQERRKARLTKLIQKMDRIGVNHSDVVSLLKKLRAQGRPFLRAILKN